MATIARFVVLLFVAFNFSVALATERSSPSGQPLKAFFISVGQGDAEFIELPNGKNVLIDGGPKADSVTGFLTEHAVKKIDYLVMTHPHSDHYMGLGWVFDHVSVGHFYDSKVESSVAGAKAIREKARLEPGCETVYARPGDSLNWDDQTQVRVLNGCPDPTPASGGVQYNNCSIVLSVSYHDSAILFQGDAQNEAITRMINQFGDFLKADVLKVGHHGSRNATTEEWMARVQPSEAFIEVGKNSYGHPTEEALTILRNANVNVHRTDQEGTVEYEIPGT
ncbi:MBL fold metallo-hydrolase [Bdellovibrionota bacterium FG-2]